jgi:hypothetical protein
MASFDFSDFYIGYPGHPRFTDSKLIEDDVVRVIIQKYEMIIFTNKGEVFGDPDFGGDLPFLLHQTKLSAETIKKDLLSQIVDYIPEILDIDFSLNVEIFPHPDKFEEFMVIEFTIAGYEVYAKIV